MWSMARFGAQLGNVAGGLRRRHQRSALEQGAQFGAFDRRVEIADQQSIRMAFEQFGDVAELVRSCLWPE